MYNQGAIYYDTPLRDRFSQQCFKLSHKIFQGSSLDPDSRILDLGCGSGLLCQLLHDQGYRVTGVDRSEEMLRLARLREGPSGDTPEYLNHDIRTFRRPDTFQGCLCFGDVLNHLLNVSDLTDLFTSLFQSLTVGGVFLADTTTLAAYRSDLWKADGKTDEREGAEIVLSSGYEEQERLGWIELMVTQDGKTTTEKTFQRYHPEDQIEGLLKQVGFSRVLRNDFNPLPELFPQGAIKNIWMCIK